MAGSYHGDTYSRRAPGRADSGTINQSGMPRLQRVVQDIVLLIVIMSSLDDDERSISCRFLKAYHRVLRQYDLMTLGIIRKSSMTRQWRETLSQWDNEDITTLMASFAPREVQELLNSELLPSPDTMFATKSATNVHTLFLTICWSILSNVKMSINHRFQCICT